MRIFQRSKSTSKFSNIPSSKLTSVLCVAMLCCAATGQAQADDKSDNPYAKTYAVQLPKDAHAIYVGAGLAGSLMHMVVEKPTKYGNFYARIGQFYEGEQAGGQVGYRYPYKFTGKNNNGVYLGVFGGQVESVKLDDERKYRLGGGADISYVGFDASRITSAGVGLYFGEEMTGKKGSKLEPRAAVMFTFSIAAGLF